VQSLPNYCRLKRQNAVLLAAVRNGVIVTKHAFYRLYRAFRTSLLRSTCRSSTICCCNGRITKIQHLLPIAAILQSCELQTGPLGGSLVGGAMFSRTYLAISGAKVARAVVHGGPPLQAG
jgi:hypothetical protein